MTGNEMSLNPVHLGLGATARVEPDFTGSLDWYEDYLRRHSQDGKEGRLVGLYTFTESWDMWEMHPHGSEVVLCTAGSITLRQQLEDGSEDTIDLGPGQYAINQPGTWHTADVESEATAVFITAGLGTQHRPR